MGETLRENPRVQVVDVVKQVPKQTHEERVVQVPRTELHVQEVTSPRSITRTTQQVVANNQAVSAPIPSGSIGISHGTSHVNVGHVGSVGGGIVGGGIVSGSIVGGGIVGGGIGSHYV